ncbi:PIN domain-containing protein [Parvularcula maris]|uniref:Ribonuclease VapC n=1 Tax=Parvularcula maris TaxID=2965077 RepID=A0A9X2RGZ7_9PROT|nr:type II toxin-antitoxin system VapC family toxin [Parvularcula maris]
MIGIDTNVLVRFLVQDDERQSEAASRFMEGLSSDRRGFLSSVVLVETSWVLERAYGASREDIASALQGLLAAREIVIESPSVVRAALRLFSSSRSVQFADAMIVETAKAAGADSVVTFDRKASREAAMTLLSTAP